MVWHKQSSYDIRCDWAMEGMSAIAGDADVVIVVDVLSFSTCVDIAVSRNMIVYPSNRAGESITALAREYSATRAGPRGAGRFSLSPETFLRGHPGERVVLSSPNGGTLCVDCGHAR